MGCLNSEQAQPDWHGFANIHFSGPCNRSCYFCIGQHMMALDPLNNLDQWPPKNLEAFVDECLARNISEVNLTGSNTDPLLYRHTRKLREYLSERIPNLVFGVRTNGAAIFSHQDDWDLFDKGSISYTSADPAIYKKTMGQGNPPNIKSVQRVTKFPLKVNIVLCPEILNGDLEATLNYLAECGIQKVNLREPYGQPHIGNPVEQNPEFVRLEDLFGMPRYAYRGMSVVYWDVHYVHVESVNLYANGEVSVDYPVTRGHCRATGKVEGQENFTKSGRIRPQWVTVNGKETYESYE